MSIFPAGWLVEPLSNVCSEIVDCLNKTATVVDGPTPYKMIRTTNVKDGRVNLDETRFVDEVVYRKWTRRFKPRRGDVILTREAPLGEVGLLRSDEHVFLGQRTMAYRANPQKLDQRFLYYSLLGPTLQAQIRMYGAGSTVEHMRVPQAESLQIPFPALATQQKIAAILSAYDDLIANNQRRISLLERMAEDIYREWFVRLRFTGHESVKLERGLPQGWRVAELGEIFKTSSGGTPARDDPSNFDGDIPWIKTGELKTTFAIGSEESITQRGIENSPAKVYPKHTVVMAMYCAMPDLSVTANDAATNQACCAFLPENSSFHHSYCYFLVKFAQLQLVMFAHGAAQQNLSQEIIKKFPVVLPSEPLILAFGEKVAPIFDSIETLMRVNKQLKSTRDALLPRLISGKLSVDALDIRFPPGMVAAGE
jgi:type I restriction enzyme, S subunit